MQTEASSSMTGGISDDELCILVFVSLFLSPWVYVWSIFLFQDVVATNVSYVSTRVVTVTMLGTLMLL